MHLLEEISVGSNLKLFAWIHLPQALILTEIGSYYDIVMADLIDMESLHSAKLLQIDENEVAERLAVICVYL